MHVQLSGLFVTLESKSWDSFEDSNNNAVNGGESHKVWFFDPTGNVLHMAKIAGGSNGVTLDRTALDTARTLTFGVEVSVSATVKARNNVSTLTVTGIAPAKTRAA